MDHKNMATFNNIIIVASKVFLNKENVGVFFQNVTMTITMVSILSGNRVILQNDDWSQYLYM